MVGYALLAVTKGVKVLLGNLFALGVAGAVEWLHARTGTMLERARPGWHAVAF